MKHPLLRALALLVILALFVPENVAGAMYTGPERALEAYADIDAYIEDRMQTLKIPGAALAIVEGNQIKYLRGYGIADSTGRPVTPQTPFMLASISKSFTALAIMQLVEQDKLDLDAAVQEYLPWFQTADQQASSEMTVQQLIYQTSGFSETDGNTLNLYSGMEEDALSDSMKQLAEMRLGNTSGEAFEYSNVNYGLLGAIIESVSGQSYEAYVQQNILTPLEMRHTHTSLADAEADGATLGYYPFFGVLIPYTEVMPYSRAITSWAGVFSSAEDMAHYLIAHLNEGHFKEQAILSPDGIDELHTPGVRVDRWSGYGMGWWVSPHFDLASQDQTSELSAYAIPIAISHEGSWANFRTVALLIPEKKVGVVVLMNINDPAVESAFGFLGWEVASMYLGNEPSYYPPYEDFIRQNARSIFTGVNLLLLASMVWFVRKLRGWHKELPAKTTRWRMFIGYVVIPAAIDVLLAWFLLAVQIPQAHTTVPLLLRFAPDLGLLAVLVFLFTLGWGLVRTIWMSQLIFRKAPTPGYDVLPA